MLLRFYRFLLLLSAPLLYLLMHVRAWRGLEEKTCLPERAGHATLARPEGKILWVHAASVGEMQSILPLVRHLLEKNPDATCLVTTVTVTAARLARKLAHERIMHQYVPFDRPTWVRRFLDYWVPSAVIWVESELWPVMLENVHGRGIPLVMINGRLSERSARRWEKVPATARHVLAQFDLCLAQSQEDAERLKRIGAKNLATAGNMKFSGDPLPYEISAYDTLKAQINARPVILFASTHDNEEHIAARAWHALSAKYPDLLVIVMPRHPARREAIAGVFDKAEVVYATRALGEPVKPETNIYLADTMGEPGLFYRLAPIVYMGNSLIQSPGGGHNPIEPAQLDCAIIYGPNMWNFAEVDRDLRAVHGSLIVRNEKDLHSTLESLLSDPERRKIMARAAKDFALAQNRVLDNVIGHIGKPFAKAGIAT